MLFKPSFILLLLAATASTAPTSVRGRSPLHPQRAAIAQVKRDYGNVVGTSPPGTGGYGTDTPPVTQPSYGKDTPSNDNQGTKKLTHDDRKHDSGSKGQDINQPGDYRKDDSHNRGQGTDKPGSGQDESRDKEQKATTSCTKKNRPTPTNQSRETTTNLPGNDTYTPENPGNTDQSGPGPSPSGPVPTDSPYGGNTDTPGNETPQNTEGGPNPTAPTGPEVTPPGPSPTEPVPTDSPYGGNTDTPGNETPQNTEVGPSPTAPTGPEVTPPGPSPDSPYGGDNTDTPQNTEAGPTPTGPTGPEVTPSGPVPTDSPYGGNTDNSGNETPVPVPTDSPYGGNTDTPGNDTPQNTDQSPSPPVETPPVPAPTDSNTYTPPGQDLYSGPTNDSNTGYNSTPYAHRRHTGQLRRRSSLEKLAY